jgi:delta-aminolevulinic acid dehydratase/porphobilinogen synthase
MASASAISVGSMATNASGAVAETYRERVASLPEIHLVCPVATCDHESHARAQHNGKKACAKP